MVIEEAVKEVVEDDSDMIVKKDRGGRIDVPVWGTDRGTNSED